MAVLFKAYRDTNGEVIYVKEGSSQDLGIGPSAVRLPGLDRTTSNDENTNETPPASHTHTASEITDFDTEVQNNAAVAANTAKNSYPSADATKLAGIETGATADQNSTEVPFDPTGTNLAPASTNLDLVVKELDTRTAGPGGLDHGNLGGLGDDDHTQYHNDTRGDIRYYTKTLLDAGQLDNRYFTESELTSGILDTRYFTETELTSGALDGRYYTESEVDTLLGAKEDTANKGAANGYAPLDANSLIPTSYLPPTTIGETFVVADIPARDALTVGSGTGEVSSGDVVIVNDASADPQVTSGGASYRWDGSAYQRLIQPDAPVQSVNGQTGIVSLTTSDVSEGTSLYYTEARVNANTNVAANTTHRGITSGNPHSVTLTEAVTADSGTDVSASELETLTDGSDAAALHNHNSQYYTQTQLNSGQLDTRYFTETELTTGALDSRYYTESEVDTLLSAKVTGPASAVNNNIVYFDGTTGKLVKDSGFTILDEDDFASDSATAVPTQQSTKAYVEKDHSWVVNQAGHGFTITNNVPLPARLNGSTYELAQADDENTLSAVYITEIIDTDNFRVKHSGVHTATGHGLTVGQYYYLSATTAGGITSIEPLNSLDDVVYYVIDANTVLLIDNRPVDRESLEKYLIKVENTDIATNINQAAFTEVPITGTTVTNENTYYTVSGNGIQIDNTRSYRLTANIHYTSTGQRVALQGQFHVNGNPVGAIVSTGYIRNSNGHAEASLHLTEYLPLNATDVVTFRVRRESTITTAANMAATATSNLSIEAR